LRALLETFYLLILIPFVVACLLDWVVG